ncbi:SRPBCC family protein [Isoptericola sp. b441]|uniref:SRPBCC family protein n=1 Tax=Actinotalea lenta TaxID=3064654 RepID=A0ABT9D6J2_9CELL|nr:MULTISPECIES: SRPBCC family protein [unclassified Isoptericola]MDO8106454.1 SRPBCC family protein [Isoptericola sp. b441]MDO8121830.1 SRPBCC family protein [Isoptericola sp. b490]
MSRRLLVAGAATVALVPVVRACHRRQLTWGSTPPEQVTSLPGDGLVPLADLAATRAIDVAAPPEAVFPWLVQLGQGRGGFYSYDALENLAGLGIHSADRIEERWQDLAVGDQVHLAEDFALDVAICDPPHALVLHGQSPADPDDADPVPFTFSWAFVLRPTESGCRLVVRERYAYQAGWVGRLVVPVSWVSFLMTERMLRGIRDRAESAAA